MRAQHYDVVVIGAGPAGLSAAIGCASAGFSVAVFERQRAIRRSPAESLHPGCATLLDRLGVGPQFRFADWPRFPGIEVGGRFQPFGADADGPWLGYHIDRARFHNDLRDRAESLGVQLHYGVRVQALAREGKQVQGVVLSGGEVSAQWVIDSSGRVQWSAAHLELKRHTLSAPLMAWRGAVEGKLDDRRAHFTPYGSGWLWTVQTQANTVAWTVLAPASKVPAGPAPMLAGAPVQLPARGFDVTWRAPRPLARPGLLLVGDAATLVDPAAGQGVFFALESGLRAATVVAKCSESPAYRALLLARYDDWAMREFKRKTVALTAMYRGLGIDAALIESPVASA